MFSKHAASPADLTSFVDGFDVALSSSFFPGLRTSHTAAAADRR